MEHLFRHSNGAGLRTHIRVLILECSLPTRSPRPSPSSRGSGEAEQSCDVGSLRLRLALRPARCRPAMEPVFALTEPPSDFLEVFDRDGCYVFPGCLTQTGIAQLEADMAGTLQTKASPCRRAFVCVGASIDGN